MADRLRRCLEAPPPEVAGVLACYQRRMERLLWDLSRCSGWSSWPESLPAALLRFFPKVLRLYNESTRFFLGYLHRCGYNVSCRLGCSHCCLQMPWGAGATELVLLYHGMWECGDFSRMIRRFFDRQQRWSALCAERRRETASGWGPRDAVSLLCAYERLQQPCPLLQGGLCMVYRYRPLACRMHFSVSPSVWCRPDHFQHGHALCFSLEPGDRVYRALEAVDGRLRLPRRQPLASALLDLTVNVLRFRPIAWQA